MGPPRCLEDDSGCIVLHTLQLLDAADWRTVEYRVAVVQSRQDQTACNELYDDNNDDDETMLLLRFRYCPLSLSLTLVPL